MVGLCISVCVCLNSFIFLVACVFPAYICSCLSLYGMFVWSCRLAKMSLLLFLFVCRYMVPSTPVCACKRTCVLTVMKGLEFAAGGEFIITLIPLEKDSFA